jgi:ABC-type multidrug transport system, ATPase component
MIEAVGITKKFDNFAALDKLNCKIKDASIYGLVGANGAGKSTFLRMLSGIYKCDEGKIMIDDQNVFENTEVKNKIAFIPDELYFLPQATINKMAKFYMEIYKDFNIERYNNLIRTFRLEPNKNINTFSKGMKRQAATILALSCMPKYLFFDETFDGLDPVMRNLVKEVIYNDSIERGTTTIITSHSLRELEDKGISFS